MKRRNFLLSAAGTLGALRFARAQEPSPNEKVNIAAIGLGGQGKYNLRHYAKYGHNIVALCDVDDRLARGAYESFPDAKRYNDYRRMLDEQPDIDAVVIATPDHHHYFASMAAIAAGKHVYCEKPLTHSVWEARELANAGKMAGLATQMGNTGQASDGVRRIAEYIADGAIGPVREVHVWTNRPIWPQGIDRPRETDPVPEHLNWDLWLGPAPERPFNGVYHPFRWRGWWDFGTGALGDIGCHRFHGVFKALHLTHPVSVEASSTAVNDETFPHASIVRYEFPARGEMPPVKLVWYDGGLKPARPDALEPGADWGDEGIMFIGDDGVILDGRLIPESLRKDYTPPPETLPRSPGHWEEWFAAIKGGPAPGANFEFAGMLTQVVLLGNVALKTGRKLHWVGDPFEITNDVEANGLLKRDYREGWAA